MRVGDALETLCVALASGGALLVVAGLVSWVVGAGVALLVATAFLMYLAQVWADASFSRRRKD